MDINKREWAGDMLRELDLDRERMPRLLASHNVQGRISRTTYRQTGLIAGTPVAIGGGDGACTGRGAGVNEPGSGYCYIGSSAWVAQLLDHPLLDSKARIFNWLDMDGEDYAATDFSGGVALVIGAEGERVSRRILDVCDKTVSLPIKGKLDSLNASVAAGILMYAVMRTR